MKKYSKAQIQEAIEYWSKQLNEEDGDDFKHSEDAEKANAEKKERKTRERNRKPGQFVVNITILDTAKPGNTGKSGAERIHKEFETAEEANKYLQDTISEYKEKYSIQEGHIRKDDGFGHDFEGTTKYSAKGYEIKDNKLFSVTRNYLSDKKDPDSIECISIFWHTYRLEQKNGEPVEEPKKRTSRGSLAGRGEYEQSDEFFAQARKDFSDYKKMSPRELNDELFSDEFEKFREKKLAENPEMQEIYDKPLPELSQEELAQCKTGHEKKLAKLEKMKNLTPEEAKTYRTFDEFQKLNDFLKGVRKEFDEMDD